LPDAIGTERSGVILRRREGKDLVIHPLGRLHARQQRVPFAVVIQRYDGASVSHQRWDIAGAQSATTGVTWPTSQVLRSEFPRANYFDLSESDQLAAQGFTQEICGVMLDAGAVATGRAVASPEEEFDEKVIMQRDQAAATPRERRRGIRIPPSTPLLEATLSSRRMHEETIWWDSDRPRAVVVRQTQPLAIGSVTTLQEQPISASVAERSEVAAVQQFVLAKGDRRDLQLVERWEVRLAS
jgi:hypothetical protein